MQAAANSPTKKPLLIVVAGPTASGKTALAIELAAHFNTSILSADSRQCYKELNIGVARPTEAQLAAVPHYFIASHSIHSEVTAASFEQYGLQVLDTLFADKNVAVLAGGTGLYIQALLQGLDAMPTIPQAVRDVVRNYYASGGIDLLTQYLHQYDPRYAAEGEMKNPQRMMRALEVALHTGTSIRELQQGQKATRSFETLYLTLDAPAPWLNPRIELRTQQMIAEGLVEEARNLYNYRHLNALQTVGYKEIFDYLDRKISLEEAITLITTHTRQYAKRQRTWFSRITAAIPTHPQDYGKVIEIINNKLLQQ